MEEPVVSSESIDKKINEAFDIDNPEIYNCTVWGYHRGHSTMTIRVWKRDEELPDQDESYLIFSFVQYFEGPMDWPGVNFYRGSDEECIELLSQTIERENAEKFVHHGVSWLLKHTTPKFEIKIIAQSVARERSLEP